MTQDNLIRVCVYLSIETRCCDFIYLVNVLVILLPQII